MSPRSGQRLPSDGGHSTDPSRSGDAVTETAAATRTSHPALPELELAEPRTRVPSQLADDAQLIAACRRGEARAMEVLYHQFKRRVFGMAHRIVGASDAEEVAQEVFVRVFRGLAAFRGDSQLSTWIYRLTVNASLSHLAKRGRRRAVGGGVLAELPAPPAIERDLGPGRAHRGRAGIAARRLPRDPRAARHRGAVARGMCHDPRVPRGHLQVSASQGARADA